MNYASPLFFKLRYADSLIFCLLILWYLDMLLIAFNIHTPIHLRSFLCLSLPSPALQCHVRISVIDFPLYLHRIEQKGGYMPLLYILIIFFVLFIFSMLKVLKEYERAVIFRLGRFIGIKGPGIFILWPIDRMVRVSLRVIAMDVPPQDVITKDNISIKVNAVAYFRVFEPGKAILEVEDYLYATSQLSQTTLRSVLGEYELDEILGQREKINLRLQKIIDQQTDPWGIKVSTVEIKHVDIPQEMQRAIARQAEAERERRAKIIHAEGELQAASKLNEAAKIISETPTGIQLRYLQTLGEIATEKNSTTIFPIPIDLFTPFIKKLSAKE
jgi:regulator of protease activity HflC (stomatin/prohibitin superfamily)